MRTPHAMHVNRTTTRFRNASGGAELDKRKGKVIRGKEAKSGRGKENRNRRKMTSGQETMANRQQKKSRGKERNWNSGKEGR